MWVVVSQKGAEINGCAGNDNAQVGVKVQLVSQQSQDEFNVNTSLVGLVDHHDAVITHATGDNIINKLPVGHEDEPAAAVVFFCIGVRETNLPADAQGSAIEGVGNKLWHLPCRLDARLRYTDRPAPRPFGEFARFPTGK